MEKKRNKDKEGLLFVLDGENGSGKDTLIEKLEIKYKGIFIFTREPGGSPYGEEIRPVLLDSPNAKLSSDLTRILGFFAARDDHMGKLIIPNLLKGNNVFSGRFDISSYAYNARTEELIKLFWELRKLVVGEYTPDLYILLDITPQTSLARKSNKGVKIDHYDIAKISELERRREAFWKFLRNIPEKHEIIDADQSEEQVYAEAVKIIDHYLIRKDGKPG